MPRPKCSRHSKASPISDIALVLWQAPQLMLGAAIARKYKACPCRSFAGKHIVFWPREGQGLSLARFIFIPENAVESPDDASCFLRSRIFRHELGHTIQSLYLGPFYLVIVGLPSFAWARLPMLRRYRARHGVSYYDFAVERWADRLGEQFFLSDVGVES